MEIKVWKKMRDKQVCELGRVFPLISEISRRLAIDENLVRKILKENNININDKGEKERREKILEIKRKRAKILYRKNKKKRKKN